MESTSNKREPLQANVFRSPDFVVAPRLAFVDRAVSVRLFPDGHKVSMRVGAAKITLTLVGDGARALLRAAAAHTYPYQGCDNSPAVVGIQPRARLQWLLLADMVFEAYQSPDARGRRERSFGPRHLYECLALMRHLDYPVYADEDGVIDLGDGLRTAHPSLRADGEVMCAWLDFGRHNYLCRKSRNPFEAAVVEALRAAGANQDFWWLCAEYADALENGEVANPAENRLPDVLAVLRSGIRPLPWEFGLWARRSFNAGRMRSCPTFAR